MWSGSPFLILEVQTYKREERFCWQMKSKGKMAKHTKIVAQYPVHVKSYEDCWNQDEISNRKIKL